MPRDSSERKALLLDEAVQLFAECGVAYPL